MELLESDVAAAVKLFAETRARDPEVVIFKESSVNVFGYALLQSGRAKEAIDALKLNSEAYPKSWNAFDSLGEAYMIAGEKELAIKSYNKSLELNPENKNAAEMVKRLTQK